MFGVFENNKLTQICSGDKSPFDEIADVIDLPDSFDGWSGIDRRELDDTLHVKPLSVRVAEGLVVLDKYHKLEGEEVVRKTDRELILEKIVPVPRGMVLEGQVLREMTADEQIIAGIISIPQGKKILDGKILDMTDREKVDAGILSVPYGHVLDGETLRPMTQVERIEAKLESLPPGTKLENGKIVRMTDLEMERAAFDANPDCWQASLLYRCDRIRDTRLRNGFSFGGHVIQADPTAQQNANGFLTSIAANLSPFPILWRTLSNKMVSFANADEFRPFASQMLAFVQAQFHAEWAAKDAIRSAATFQEKYSAFTSYQGNI